MWFPELPSGKEHDVFKGGRARLPSARIRFGSRAWKSWPIALVVESQDSGLYGSCPCGGNHFYITHPSAQSWHIPSWVEISSTSESGYSIST